jgi:DNA-damage-inducible protein D
MENQLAIFENKPIRRVEHEGEMYFAVIDIIAVLIETTSPRQYWTKVKKNLIDESQLQPFWLQLKMEASDGKNYKTDCADTEGVFRILMSVPSNGKNFNFLTMKQSHL